MRCVYIPIQNSQEKVKVVLDELPKDVTDILDILKAEQAPLDLWLIIAKEYFRQGKINQFIQILEEGSGPEIAQYYSNVTYDRIAILNALGAYYTYLGKVETKQDAKEQYFIEAGNFYSRASMIDMQEPSTWIGKGQLLLAKGDIDQSYNAFTIALEGDRENNLALIGLGCVLFARGRYEDSLVMFKKSLRKYPNAPGVRLGIAFCRYKLGNSEKAQLAFLRVLELDPENVEALVAIGAYDVQTNEVSNIRSGMDKMKRAFEIYPYCSMALNYLASHFFFTGQHFLVEQLSESVLTGTKHGLTKAHSYYNLARSYHAKGNYETARAFYVASVEEIKNPQEFVLSYYGLGQVQMKLGDLQKAACNFEKVLEVQPGNPETMKALGHIYAQFGNNYKALELYKKATKADSRDPEVFLTLAELLASTDTGAALTAFITAHDLLKKRNEDVPLELLNNIGALHVERGEFELAGKAFKEALGDGIWCQLIYSEGGIISDSSMFSSSKITIDACADIHEYVNLDVFDQLEQKGVALELPWEKVTTVFNYATLLEKIHKTEAAITLYRLILFKYPQYTDTKLRLAAIAKARHQFKKSQEMINDVLKTEKDCVDALLMLGDLELKSDIWVKAKETFLKAKDASGEKDSFAAICLGNWNYYAAIRNENRAPRLEATHYEKAKELYTKALVQNPSNLYAANGAGIVFAERGQFDTAKELFTEVQEAAGGNSNPDVWINLAHIHFAQGNIFLAIKMYENCLHKFYYNTDSQVLLYIARMHYEVEQWNECRKALLRAIHLDPCNHKLRFNVGFILQKFSSLTLQKTKRTVIEVRATVTELKNAVRVFSLLHLGLHLEEKKMETHLKYCEHLLEAAKVHCEIAERQDEQNMQRLEVLRRMKLADVSQEKAEEQRKIQMEQRKQEEERRIIMQEEKRLALVKAQWMSTERAASGLKRKGKRKTEHDEAGENSTKIRKRGETKKNNNKDKKIDKGPEETEAADPKDKEGENANKKKKKRIKKLSDISDVNLQSVLDEILAATGLEDSDAEENAVVATGLEDADVEENTAAPSNMRRRMALSESDDKDKPSK